MRSLQWRGNTEGFCTCELAIDAVGECGGHCISDNNDDGVCDEYAIFLEAEEISSSEFGTTYRVYVNFSGPGYTLGWIGGATKKGYLRGGSIYSRLLSERIWSLLGHLINPAFYVLFPELEIDSWLTVGAQPGDESGPWFLGLDWEELKMEMELKTSQVFSSPLLKTLNHIRLKWSCLSCPTNYRCNRDFNTSIGYWDDNGNLLESDLEQIEFGN